MGLPKIAGLCPTYRHPQLLANSVGLWLLQTYPLHLRCLYILDDGQTFATQSDTGWYLVSVPQRLPTISAKYNRLLEFVAPDVQYVFVWEDDDIYLPDYLMRHVEALNGEPVVWSHPDVVLSDYGGRVHAENGQGRFHSAIATSLEALYLAGGWPDTRRADFDQQLMAALERVCGAPRQPWHTAQECQFIYRWHSGAAHCQSTMRGPDDETWYDRAADVYQPVPYLGTLVPRLDTFTLQCLHAMQEAKLL